MTIHNLREITMRKTIFYIIIAIIVAGSLWSVAMSRLTGPNKRLAAPNKILVEIGANRVEAELATSSADLFRGLSGRAGLVENEAMLFLFAKPDFHRFWMKEMNFPIDIIWIGEDRTIIEITPELAPSTYPQTFTSPKPAKYVLELPAGWAAEHRIKRGDRVNF
jgi:uncharacterized membrane protein (UPF0127 family)